MSEFERACDPIGPHPEGSPLTRIQRAVVDLLCEHDYAGLHVEDVLESAEVSRDDFDRYFASLRECCLEIFECIALRCEAQLYSAYDVPGSWRYRLRCAAYATARFLRENPLEARFAVLELRRADDFVKARVESAVELYTDLIDAGRAELAEPDSVSAATAQATAGSILNHVVMAQARGASYAEAERFVPELMYLAVRPYLGQRAALEELTAPAPLAGGSGG